MRIDVEEVKKLVKEIPAIARAHPGVKLLVEFVGKVVGSVNKVCDRVEALEKEIADLKASKKDG